MIATPFTSRTDLSTIQVNLAGSEEAKKDLLKGGDKLFNMVEQMGWSDGRFTGVWLRQQENLKWGGAVEL